VKVIVKLLVPKIDELTTNSQEFCTVEPGKSFAWQCIEADFELENAIAIVTDIVLDNLSGTDYQVNHTYKSVPYLVMDVSVEALQILNSLPEVLNIEEDQPCVMVGTLTLLLVWISSIRSGGVIVFHLSI
jgi:hypothetical protein